MNVSEKLSGHLYQWGLTLKLSEFGGLILRRSLGLARGCIDAQACMRHPVIQCVVLFFVGQSTLGSGTRVILDNAKAALK
jgi:hypothetical protein